MPKLTETVAQHLAEIDAGSPCPTRRMLMDIHGLEVRISTPGVAMAQVDHLETHIPKDPK